MKDMGIQLGAMCYCLPLSVSEKSWKVTIIRVVAGKGQFIILLPTLSTQEGCIKAWKIRSAANRHARGTADKLDRVTINTGVAQRLLLTTLKASSPGLSPDCSQ